MAPLCGPSSGRRAGGPCRGETTKPTHPALLVGVTLGVCGERRLPKVGPASTGRANELVSGVKAPGPAWRATRGPLALAAVSLAAPASWAPLAAVSRAPASSAPPSSPRWATVSWDKGMALITLVSTGLAIAGTVHSSPVQGLH